jgi:ADP-ribose pyrophosphatase
MSATPSYPRRVLAEGKHIRFLERGGWEYVDRPLPSGLVCIAAETDDGRIVLVEQFRPPVDTTVIELPAGLVGDAGGAESEGLLAGAQRELLEETGYVAAEWELAAAGPPSAGISTEYLHLFIARGLRRVAAGGGDESEDITVHEVPLAGIHAWLEDQEQRGAMLDLKLYTGLYFLARRPRRGAAP